MYFSCKSLSQGGLYFQFLRRLGAVLVLLLQNNPVLLAQKGSRPIPALEQDMRLCRALKGWTQKRLWGKSSKKIINPLPHGATRLILMAKHSCSISQLAIYQKKNHMQS